MIVLAAPPVGAQDTPHATIRSTEWALGSDTIAFTGTIGNLTPGWAATGVSVLAIHTGTKVQVPLTTVGVGHAKRAGMTITCDGSATKKGGWNFSGNKPVVVYGFPVGGGVRKQND
jgi:hypothetical protein